MQRDYFDKTSNAPSTKRYSSANRNVRFPTGNARKVQTTRNV